MKTGTRALRILLAGLTMLGVAVGGEASWLRGLDTHGVSPDGRYGLLIPTLDFPGFGDGPTPNYFADLKAHRILGEIRDGDWYFGKQHAGLTVTWAPDSSLCVIEYQTWSSTGSLLVIDPHDPKLRQVEIKDRMLKAVKEELGKVSNESHLGYNLHFRFGQGRKVQVRALCTTNPREFEDHESHFAHFQGTFDAATQKWSGVATRLVSQASYEALDDAYSSPNDAALVWGKAAGTDVAFDGTAKVLDEQMNHVYAGLKLLLPAESFAALKADQLAWLKKRDAARSAEEKCALVKERLIKLQEMIWEARA